MQRLNPKGVHPPLGAYAHTVRVPPEAAWVAISGQVGMGPSGKLASGPQRQTEQALRNLLACLRGHGLRKEHLVKLTVYLTDARHVEPYRAGRRKVLGDEATPASTLVIVAGLAAPEMLVEVEAWAAKAGDS